MQSTMTDKSNSHDIAKCDILKQQESSCTQCNKNEFSSVYSVEDLRAIQCTHEEICFLYNLMHYSQNEYY